MNKVFTNTIKQNFPWAVPLVREFRGAIIANFLKFTDKSSPRFNCSICGYEGPFVSHSGKSGKYAIRYTQCPRCELFERHRLQFLVVKSLFDKKTCSQQSILHFAPEMQIEKLFKGIFGTHKTADIEQAGVDYLVDICDLPFDDKSFDVVFASHVLEHVQDDNKALSEVRRILRKGGIAILPVPVVSPYTIEYGAPNTHEFGHVRAVGLDYFERYKKHFRKVDIMDSTSFDGSYQLHTYEDRSFYPTKEAPKRVPMEGERHLDYVPICYL